jgi:hypothetical protein
LGATSLASILVGGVLDHLLLPNRTVVMLESCSQAPLPPAEPFHPRTRPPASQRLTAELLARLKRLEQRGVDIRALKLSFSEASAIDSVPDLLKLRIEIESLEARLGLPPEVPEPK